MKKVQGGFTLIELVMVIVILGVLAAVAIPKFVDLKGDAQTAAVKGVAGAAASASAINYASCSAVNNVVTANKCVKVASCDGVTAVMSGGAWPTGYTTTATAIATNGTTESCTLTLTDGAATFTAPFEVIAAGI